MSCENFLKVVTGSRIVSPLAMVRKSNIPALSRKVLSLASTAEVRWVCLETGFAFAEMLYASGGEGVVPTWCCRLWWTWVWDPFYRNPSFHKWQMGDKRSFGRRFRFPLVGFLPSTVRCHR